MGFAVTPVADIVKEKKLKSLGYILLIVFIGYVAVKYFSVTVSVQKKAANKIVARPGISTFCTMAAPNLRQQVHAFMEQNECQTAEPGFSASLGPNENQPCNVASIQV